MRNKSIYITMLILAISFLVGMYVLKIWYPEEFMLTIQNEKIIQIGNFIDNHIIIRYICEGITAFITYWLYCCACTRRLHLKWYENLYILATVVLCRVINFFDENIAIAISTSAFIFLPAITKGNIKIAGIVYVFHCMAQCLMLQIRNLPMYLISMNYLTILFMTLDCYLWLILFYIIFNFKKENKKV